MDDELLAVACTPGISHAAFRLYAILLGVERRKGARGNYFPVTLLGLQKLHPGTSEKVAGFTTIIKQVAELRQHKLVVTRAAMPRNEPNLPILLKVQHVDPEQYRWRTTSGPWASLDEVPTMIEMQ